MITHQEALELVRILFFNINEKTLQELNRTSKIYDKLDNYIAQQEKKEKLLKELKVIFNRHSLRLDRMREWFNLQILESKVLDDIEKLIEEIENETKRN